MQHLRNEESLIRLTINNKRKIYEQNYQNFLKLQKNLQSSENEHFKYKLYYEAHCQLELLEPQCNLGIINDDIKLSDLHKIYRGKKSSTVLLKNYKKLTKDASFESLKNASSTSDYVTLSNCSSNENIESNKSNGEKNNARSTNILDENEDDDYNIIVNAVSAEVEEDYIKNENSEYKLNLQKNDENPKCVRRTTRARQPVLYSEDLSHIKFIGSSKYSYNLNRKHSLAASTKNPSGSKKNINNSNSVDVTPTHQTSYAQINSTQITSRNSNILLNDSNDYYKEVKSNGNYTYIDQHNNSIKLQPLGKTAKDSVLNLQLGEKISNALCTQPTRITIRIVEGLQFDEEQKIAAAVSSISNEKDLNLIQIPVKKVAAKRKRKSRNTKNQKLSKQPKSELAQYIETFVEGANGDDGQNVPANSNNGQHLQQIPYQSPQNAGVSTTTCECISAIPNSSTVTLGEIFNLENQSGFNIINYIEGDGSALPINLESENQTQTIQTSTIIDILNKSSPRHITSTTDSIQQITDKTTSSYDNNIFFHQIAPPEPPQPAIKNHYQRALSVNVKPVIDISSQYQVINTTLPSAHQSSTIYNKVAVEMENPLDLSQNTIDLDARDTKQKLLAFGTCNNNENSANINIISLAEYKKRYPSNKILNNDTVIIGRDMPLLSEDDNGSVKFNKLSEIQSQLKPKINLKNDKNSDSSQESNNNNRQITIIDSRILPQKQVKNYQNSNNRILNENFLNDNEKTNKNNIDECVTKQVLEKTEMSIIDNKSNDDKSVQKINRKSKENSDNIDKMFPMGDNDDLDYEQDVDLDYLDINSSPMHIFDTDYKETKTTKTVPNIIDDFIDPSKVQEVNKTYETVDIFGSPEKDNSTRPIKDFKIPKIDLKSKNNESTFCSSDTQVLNRTSVLDCNEENMKKQQIVRYWPNNPTNIIKPNIPIHNLHTRNSAPSTSIPSFSAATSSRIIQSPESLNSSSYRINGHISHVFGSPCFDYLRGNCTRQSENCRYNHIILPNEKVVKASLLELSDSYLDKAYVFSNMHLQIFNKYFGIFFQLYGQKNNREMLSKIIEDSQKFKNSTDYLQPFRNLLIEIGWSEIESVQFIIDNWCENSDISKNHIINMVIDADPSAFKSILEHYSKIPNYRFEVESINKLAAYNNKYKNFDLIQLLLNIISCVPKETLLHDNNYHNEELIKFLETVKNFNVPNKSNNNDLMTNKIARQTQPLGVVAIPQIRRTIVQPDYLINMLNQQIPPANSNLFNKS